MEHLFSADQTSIADYKLFGNATTFYTTYKTNKYNMSLGLF